MRQAIFLFAIAALSAPAALASQDVQVWTYKDKALWHAAGDPLDLWQGWEGLDPAAQPQLRSDSPLLAGQTRTFGLRLGSDTTATTEGTPQRWHINPHAAFAMGDSVVVDFNLSYAWRERADGAGRTLGAGAGDMGRFADDWSAGLSSAVTFDRWSVRGFAGMARGYDLSGRTAVTADADALSGKTGRSLTRGVFGGELRLLSDNVQPYANLAYRYNDPDSKSAVGTADLMLDEQSTPFAQDELALGVGVQWFDGAGIRLNSDLEHAFDRRDTPDDTRLRLMLQADL